MRKCFALRLEPQQEERLISQVKKGDEEAFSGLYESYAAWY
jgi:hypothetical protein